MSRYNNRLPKFTAEVSLLSYRIAQDGLLYSGVDYNVIASVNYQMMSGNVTTRRTNCPPCEPCNPVTKKQLCYRSTNPCGVNECPVNGQCLPNNSSRACGPNCINCHDITPGLYECIDRRCQCLSC